MTLPIRVYPALRVRIVRRGRHLTARVTGRDGVVLSRRWTRGRSRVTLTVADASGGTASASLHTDRAVCKAGAP